MNEILTLEGEAWPNGGETDDSQEGGRDILLWSAHCNTISTNCNLGLGKLLPRR